MINLELLERTLRRIEAHPDQFDMATWGTDCGTTACLAGHALLESGYTLNVSDVVWRPNGTPVHSAEREAAELLGLTEDQHHALFYACLIQTPAQLRAHVEEVLSR